MWRLAAGAAVAGLPNGRVVLPPLFIAPVCPFLALFLDAKLFHSYL